jgi:hypothetical protein
MAGTSVPRILLSLGAGCVLVAAVVFLAVTWASLGVAGRTGILLGLTAAAAGLTAWLARRGLRAAAESLALVSLGLTVLDLFGARTAGWLDDLGDPGFAIALGATLLVVATGTAAAARRTPVGRLVGAEATAPLGSLVLALGLAGLDRLPDGPALVLGLAVAASGAGMALRLRLPAAGWGGFGVAGLAWLGLVAHGFDQALDHPTYRELWGQATVWPLLAAVAFAGGAAAATRLPRQVRVGAAGAAWLVLAGTALVPYTNGSHTTLVLAVAVVLSVSAALMRLLPTRWRLTGAATVLLELATMTAICLDLLADAVRRMGDAAAASWSGYAGDSYPSSSGYPLAPWLLPVCALALAAAASALRPVVQDASGKAIRLSRTHVLAGASASSLLIGAATLALYPTPVWGSVAVGCSAAIGYAGWWLRGGQPVVLLCLSGAAGAVAVLVGVHAAVLTIAALAVLLLVAGAAQMRARNAAAAAGMGMLLAAALGGETWTVGQLINGAVGWVGMAALMLLALLTLGAATLPNRWWSAPASQARTGIEAGAAATTVPVGLAGVVLAPPAAALSWAAVYLTIAGAAVCAAALLAKDRRWLVRPGGLLLAAASWVRLWDVGVHAPEAYTLPAAVVLVLLGLHRLRRDARADTIAALGPGLALALTPSLLWSLAQPVGIRPLLLGIACFVLVLAGARLRWAAPLLAGGLVGSLLVIRLGAPYVEASMPRTVLIGAAGAVLIALGATWEQRLKNARQLAGYVRRLR